MKRASEVPPVVEGRYTVLGAGLREADASLTRIEAERRMETDPRRIRRAARLRNPLAHPTVVFDAEAVREVGNGGVYLPPAIARNVAFARPGFAQNPLSKLTSREMEILRLLSSGKSLSEIAWLVHSSYKTVANTSSIMRQKLGVRTSAELVRLAIESGVG